MEALLFKFNKSDDKTGGADSFTDQLNSKYSVAILAVFALLASTGNYFHQPISCWCPKDYESSQVEFIENTCWTQTTFYVPYNQTVMGNYPTTKISYYQWISLILVSQAFLFYLPNSIWKMMSKKSGIALSSITDATKRCRKSLDSEANEGIMQFASNTLINYLNVERKQAADGIKKWFIFKGTYLSSLYLVVKFLYVLNAIGQLFLLNGFLGDNYHVYGFDFMSRMAKGKKWGTSQRFPKVTLCNIPIRALGNIHKSLFQCTLPMNLIYEMMFLVLWFWLVFVSAATCFSFVKWCLMAIHKSGNFKYVLKLLLSSDCVDPCSGKPNEIKEFVYYYLRKDGCFILKIVESNSGDWIASNLAGEVWQKYQAKRCLGNKPNKRYSFEASDEGIVVDKLKYLN